MNQLKEQQQENDGALIDLISISPVYEVCALRMDI